MTPELQTFARTDSGYHQFCEQYNLAVADPSTLNDYKNWVLDAMREEGMIEGGRREGRKEGMKEGRKEGMKEGRKEGMKEGRKEERKIWEAVVADKDALIAELQDLIIAEQNLKLLDML